LDFVLAALRAVQHAPDQRDAIQILNNGDSEVRHEVSITFDYLLVGGRLAVP